MKNKMTVIMPSYNNGEYMPRALDSVLMQEINFSLQIIITDDCSTDNSKEVMQYYKSKYPDIITTLYSDKNEKLFCNQLKAILLMDTEYFCVLDPDDYWTDKRFLEKAISFLDKNKEFTIYSSNAQMIYTDLNVIEDKEFFINLNVESAVYSYKDYLNNKAHIMTTVGCVYRNCIFNGQNSMAKKYYDLKNTIYEDSFRADTARNLMHLQLGNIFFKNENIGVYQINGKGLWTSLAEFYKQIHSSFSTIAYYEFFEKEYLSEYFYKTIKFFKKGIKTYYKNILNGEFLDLDDNILDKIAYIIKWLHDNKETIEKNNSKRLAFDLEKYSDIDNRTLIIWGTGKGAEDIVEKYSIHIKEKDFFVDINKNKWGKECMERLIESPDKIKEFHNKYVLIASSYYKDIVRYIRENNICKDEEIINIFDYIDNGV